MNDITRETIVQILRHHQKVGCFFKLLRVLLLERPELIDRVEARLLDTSPGIKLFKAHHLSFNLDIGIGGARIAIGNCIGAKLALFVKENEVHAPRIYAD